MGEIDKGMPQIGMRFRNPDEAWVFWVAYGGRAGFDVRKRNKYASKIDGEVTSCTFVCSNEGIRKKGITSRLAYFMYLKDYVRTSGCKN
jgi:zinc finger SWIM domain-containing protein 3